ncbi:hypothetical protein PTNB29_10457 [Pyrenophora teres f. teres]|nr:hypothetical protein PTNB29_10457 [Pyrenophora teres f. teres]
MSTLIRAAWALLASSYTSSDDVVFGATVTGRNAPVAGIEAMAGPTIATVPVRVRVQHSHKVSEFLHSVQQQATEMIPYEQTGLHETAKVQDQMETLPMMHLASGAVTRISRTLPHMH